MIHVISSQSHIKMAMEQVFSDTCLALPLIGQGSILISGFEFFLKNQGRVRVLPHPRLSRYIYIKINFKIKLNLNFKII